MWFAYYFEHVKHGGMSICRLLSLAFFIYTWNGSHHPCLIRSYYQLISMIVCNQCLYGLWPTEHNQMSWSLTSNILDPKTAAQWLRFQLGLITYFEPQKVCLDDDCNNTPPAIAGARFILRHRQQHLILPGICLTIPWTMRVQIFTTAAMSYRTRLRL